MRSVLVLAVGLLPASRVKNCLLRALGFGVHPTAVIKPCLLLRPTDLVLGESALLGFGCVVRACSLAMGPHAMFGQLNWITAAPTLGGPCALSVGKHAAITSRHYIDCSGGVEISDFVTIAGVRSVFITHGLDVVANRQTTAPISIGTYCLVGSCVKVTPGSRVGPRSQVAMGAVVHGALAGGSLYAGVPARRVRAAEGAYFDRTTGFVE